MLPFRGGIRERDSTASFGTVQVRRFQRAGNLFILGRIDLVELAWRESYAALRRLGLGLLNFERYLAAISEHTKIDKRAHRLQSNIKASACAALGERNADSKAPATPQPAKLYPHQQIAATATSTESARPIR